ncbi:MAG: substrate-binding domain-containing protein, partial [Selenomonas sp.]|nr:substrate-binding domain-containing protein [Selenomonas sp.]
DGMAIGAVQALRDAGRLNGCLVSGVDAVESALQLVKKGEMAQTVQQDPKALAEGTFQLVQDCLSGKTPSNSVVNFTSITKDNINQFVK